jgi:hypothetical protein
VGGCRQAVAHSHPFAERPGPRWARWSLGRAIGGVVWRGLGGAMGTVVSFHGVTRGRSVPSVPNARLARSHNYAMRTLSADNAIAILRLEGEHFEP